MLWELNEFGYTKYLKEFLVHRYYLNVSYYYPYLPKLLGVEKGGITEMLYQTM